MRTLLLVFLLAIPASLFAQKPVLLVPAPYGMPITVAGKGQDGPVLTASFQTLKGNWIQVLVVCEQIVDDPCVMGPTDSQANAYTPIVAGGMLNLENGLQEEAYYAVAADDGSDTISMIMSTINIPERAVIQQYTGIGWSAPEMR
jgi:hypothetical protein